MPLKPVHQEEFGGLDLRRDPATGSALVCIDVTLENGYIRSRNGSRLFYDMPDLPVGMFSFDSPDSGAPLTPRPRLIAATGEGLFLLSITGSLLASQTLPVIDDGGISAVAVGTPSLNTVYVCAAAGSSVYSTSGVGSTWTLALGGATCCVGMSPSDNRLVVANALGFGKLEFSDPGAPTTFAPNNYVIVGAGDGEGIVGMTVFNNQLFVFKRTKFYVFYGQSTDSTGEPVFNYRTVDVGIGLHPAAPQAVCSAPDGVYFIGQDGVYRTTGGPPICISEPLRPFFEGDTPAYWPWGGWNATSKKQRITWVHGQLYVALQGLNGGLLFVYDVGLKGWSCWSKAVSAMAPFRRSTTVADSDVLFFGEGLNFNILAVDPTLADDAGENFAAAYRSGFTDMGAPGQEKTIRETTLLGYGNVSFGWARELSTTADPFTAVKMGTRPALARALHQRAVVGERLAWQITSGLNDAGTDIVPWALHSVTASIRETRPVGVWTT
jgi:hypothetical protein